MKKKLLALIVAVAVILFSAAMAESDAPVWEFDADDGRITAYNGSGGEVVVPDSVDGVTVTEIDINVFNGRNDITSVIFPDTVEVLCGSVCAWMDNLTSIRLPESLLVMESGCLQGPDALKEVVIPASVRYIGTNVFLDAASLETVTFEGKCPFLEKGAFKWVPESVVYRVPDDEVEAYRAAFEAIGQPSLVEPSGKPALAGHEDFVRGDFDFDPETGTVLAYNGNDRAVSVPETIDGVTVTRIGPKAFSFKDNLLVLTLPDTVTAVEDEALAHTPLLYVNFPKSLKTIGNKAYYGHSLKQQALPEGLESIGEEAFHYCAMPTDLYLPEGLKTLGKNVFGSTVTDARVHFPSTIEYIDEDVFCGGKVKYVSFAGHEPPKYMSPNAFGEKARTELLDIDLAWDISREDYEAFKAYLEPMGFENATVWRANPTDAGKSVFVGYTVGESRAATYSEDGYLSGYSGTEESISPYTSVDFNTVGSVNIIGVKEGALKGNAVIRSFYPHHCGWFTEIQAEAFADSTLEYIELFDSITTIGKGAFRGCINMKELTLPDSLTAIGEGAFDGLDGLETLTVLCDAAYLPEGAFKNLPSLKTAYIESGAIPDGCFEGSALETLVLGAGVTGAGDRAFANTNISEFVIPSGFDAALTAFDGLPAGAVRLADDATDAQKAVWEEKLIARVDEPAESGAEFEFDAETGSVIRYLGTDADVVIPSEIGGVPVRSVSSGAFDDFADAYGSENVLPIRSVVIPETVEKLGDGLFRNLRQLESVVCYAPLKTTGRAMFYQSENLKEVVFVNGVKEIGASLFESCGPLERLYFGGEVEKIASQAFTSCDVKSLYLNARTIDSWAVRSCESLTEIHLGKRFESASSGAIVNCPKLSEIYIEGDVFPMGTGLTGQAASEIRVYVRPGTSSDDQRYAQKSVCMLSAVMPAVTVEEKACAQSHAAPDFVPATVPADAAPNGENADETETVSAPNGENADETETVSAPNGENADETEAVSAPSGESAFYVGEWVLTGLETGGAKFAPADFGIEMTLTLNADGGAVFAQMGEKMPGTWRADGESVFVVMAGSEAEFVKKDESLTAESDGATMIFTRVGAEAPASDEAETASASNGENTDEVENVSAPSGESAFYVGEWVLTGLETGGAKFAPADFGIEMTLTLNADGGAVFAQMGEKMPGTWRADGESVFVVMAGSEAEFVKKDESLTAESDGATMIFTRIGAEEPASDGENADEAETASATNGENTDEAEVASATNGDSANEADAFVGVWYGIYMKSGLLEGEPKAVLGSDVQFTLNADGTGELSYVGAAQPVKWYERDGIRYIGNGDAFDMPAALTEDGNLLYGTEDGNYILLKAANGQPADEAKSAQTPRPAPTATPRPTPTPASEKAPAQTPKTTPTPAAPTPGVDPVKTAEPSAPIRENTAPNASSDGLAARMDKKYVCVKATASGMELDIKTLGGEYAITFHENGMADYVMVGVPVPNLTWKMEGGALVVDYFGQKLAFVPTETGFTLDFFGSMVMTFEPEN